MKTICYFYRMKQSPILEEIARQLQAVLIENDKQEKTGFRQIQEQIASIDPLLHERFLHFANAYQAWMFIKQDFELRSKVKDIWQMHCDRARAESLGSFELLKTYCASKQLPISWPDMQE